MATITISAAMAFINASLSTQLNSYAAKAFSTVSNLSIGGQLLAAVTPAALPVSGLSAPGGFFFFVNNDPTNYIQILTSVSGVPFLRIEPGEVAMGRFDSGITAPAVAAGAGTPQLAYFTAGA
jgi:hypothetical protein